MSCVKESDLYNSIRMALTTIDNIESQLKKFDEELETVCKDFNEFYQSNGTLRSGSVEERRIILLNFIVQNSGYIYIKTLREDIALDDVSKQNISIIRDLLESAIAICKKDDGE